jgi:hypothetical protein
VSNFVDEHPELYEKSVQYMERCKTLLTQSRFKSKQAKKEGKAVDEIRADFAKETTIGDVVAEKDNLAVAANESNALVEGIEDLSDSEAQILLKEEQEGEKSGEVEIVISEVNAEERASEEEGDSIILKYLTTELESSEDDRTLSEGEHESRSEEGDDYQQQRTDSTDEEEVEERRW